jgi:hypothetical protein
VILAVDVRLWLEDLQDATEMPYSLWRKERMLSSVREHPRSLEDSHAVLPLPQEAAPAARLQTDVLGSLPQLSPPGSRTAASATDPIEGGFAAAVRSPGHGY